LEYPHILAHAILIDFHFLRLQIGDSMIVLVAHNEVEDNLARRGPDYRPRWLLVTAGLRDHLRNEGKNERENR
jgi:hypothetical protein